MQFTIGEFSKIAGLTVKALRLYHDEGLLVPVQIDPQTGYRYYDSSQIDTARAIAYLRSLEFPLSEIKQILGDQSGDSVLNAMLRHQSDLRARIRKLRSAVRSLDDFITHERQAKAMTESTFDIQDRSIPTTLIAGIRMKGRYSDCGQAFARLGRNFGRFINGKPFLLHYDGEFKEDDADFEAAVPVRQSKAVDGVSVRQLPAAHCICLMHKGPYDQLGRSYAKILAHIKQDGRKILMPTREVYIKGPGMIFKGNPKNYITEIQIPIE